MWLNMFVNLGIYHTEIWSVCVLSGNVFVHVVKALSRSLQIYMHVYT